MAAMGRGFDDPGASTISSVSKSGDEYLVALQSQDDGETPVAHTLWSSCDLVDWQSVKLPSVLVDQNMKLLGAFRQGSAMLFAVQRTDFSDFQARQPGPVASSELTLPALPQGVELWMGTYAE